MAPKKDDEKRDKTQYAIRNPRQLRHIRESSVYSTTSDAVYGPELAHSHLESDQLLTLKDHNRTEWLRLQKSSEDYKLEYDPRSRQKTRLHIKRHCESKLKLLDNIKKEIELARAAAEKSEPLSDEQLRQYNQQMELTDTEIFILRRQQSDLTCLIMLSSKTSTSEAYHSLAKAYGAALTKITSSLHLHGRDPEIWPTWNRELLEQDEFKEALIRTYEPESQWKPQTGNKRWCPILSSRRSGPLVWTAAHIMPNCLGKDLASHLFGVPEAEGKEVLYNPENGMIMSKEAET
jgi:hypothetical protein